MMEIGKLRFRGIDVGDIIISPAGMVLLQRHNTDIV